jgi:hypothetical protein
MNFDEMPESEIFDLISGFLAYDMGATDSGIRDDAKKAALIKWLKLQLDKPENAHRITPKILDRFVAEYYFAPAALEQGYGLEDCRSFMRWLEDNEIVYFGR